MRERLSVTVPEDLIAKAREMAKKEDRTLSAMIAVLLRDAILRKEKAA
jgi:metal-responsive CopG/Arc/MetJ family transcriptional regulator